MYIYVAGRGHSGSTILDIMLGGGSAIESVGELGTIGTRGLSGDKTGHLCGCGAVIAECPFWTRVREAVEARCGPASFPTLMREVYDLSDVRWFPRALLPASPGSPLRRMVRTLAAVEEAVKAVTGKPHLLDSNKEPTRALLLLRYHPGSRVIHLVRDPRGIVASHYWRVQGEVGFVILRRRFHPGRATMPLFLMLAAGAWTVGNLCAELALRTAPDRTMRLRYEDLRDHPAEAIRRIGRTFGVQLDDVADRIERHEPFPVGHNVGGNHIRREGAVRFDPGAEKARRPLPRWVRLMTVALCWPLMRRYGYTTHTHGPGDIAPPAAARLQEGG